MSCYVALIDLLNNSLACVCVMVVKLFSLGSPITQLLLASCVCVRIGAKSLCFRDCKNSVKVLHLSAKCCVLFDCVALTFTKYCLPRACVRIGHEIIYFRDIRNSVKALRFVAFTLLQSCCYPC